MTVKLELSQAEFQKALDTGVLQRLCDVVNSVVTEELNTEMQISIQEVTKEQVRARLAELSSPAVKILLGEFGVKKLSDIKQEQYAELLKRAACL
jgi:hypothetical protein